MPGILWPSGPLANKPVLSPGEVWFATDVERLHVGTESGVDLIFYASAVAGGNSIMSFVVEISNDFGSVTYNFRYVQNPTGLPAPTIVFNEGALTLNIAIEGFSFTGKTLIPHHERSGGADDYRVPVSFGGSGDTITLNLQPYPGDFEKHFYGYAIPL